MASKTEVEAYLRRGLRDLWYPVVASWEVSSAPLGITRLSENIVLWRDHNGQVHALEDRCPHRGARLSMGWNLGDRVACWYHGVEVDGTGVVKDVPAVSACPLVGTRCLRSYPVQERHGAIFLYFATDADAPVPALDLPEELEDQAQYSNFLCTAGWKCGYEYAIDNVMDPMHGAYLHAASHSMAEGDRSAEMQIAPTDSGFVFEKIGQRGVNFDWVEFGHGGGFWLRLSIPYRPQFGPGGPFWIVGMAVPVDETNCRVFFWRIRKVQDWQRDVWRFMYRNRLEQLHWDVLEQDRVILENLAPNARGQEFLYAHDAGLTRVRRMMQKMAERQLAQQRQATPAVAAEAEQA
jgi:phenylpropionate dioxygenase-like ring-hydroxylating dioxygenase large terminal subunit